MTFSEDERPAARKNRFTGNGAAGWFITDE